MIAYNRTDEEVAEVIGCERVIYQSLEDLIDCCKTDKITKFEDGVFTGNYVTGVEDGYIQELEEKRESIANNSSDMKAEVDIGLYNCADY